MKKNYTLYLIICSFFLFSFATRFYNLNWGAPFYFHPDERNIASSISQLRFPEQLNPHFFAYGTFPIYTIYTTAIIWNKLEEIFIGTTFSNIFTVSFEKAIIISRLYSASLSLLILLFMYKIAKEVASKQVAFVSLALGVTSVGFIQYAHFGTFEMWLTFFTVLLSYLLIKWIQTHMYRYFLYASLAFGLLMSIKISSLVLSGLFLFAIICIQRSMFVHFGYLKKIIRGGIFIGGQFLVFFVITAVVYLTTSPFVILDFLSFKGSMAYESSVALGTLPVFYTGGFVDTIPIIFQLLHIYPFILNPILSILLIPAFVYVLYLFVRTKNLLLGLVLIASCILFLSQAFLYVKWTRYMIPTLPFFYICLALFLVRFYTYVSNNSLVKKPFARVAFSFFIVVLLLFPLSYIWVVHIEQDTRIKMAVEMKNIIPPNASIISEVYDMGITPFNPYFSNITLFNFYDLEHVTNKVKELDQAIEKTDYIIIPSQRIMKSRLLHSDAFPQGYTFYNNLFSSKTEFSLISQTECRVLCYILYGGNPVYSFEETINVFDRPMLFVFRKNKGQ